MAHGTLSAKFDTNQKIELLEFITSNHEEYVSRTRVIDTVTPFYEWAQEWCKESALGNGKRLPEMGKIARPIWSPPTAPPDINIPESKVKINIGMTPSMFQFLEVSMNIW